MGFVLSTSCLGGCRFWIASTPWPLIPFLGGSTSSRPGKSGCHVCRIRKLDPPPWADSLPRNRQRVLSGSSIRQPVITARSAKVGSAANTHHPLPLHTCSRSSSNTKRRARMDPKTGIRRDRSGCLPRRSSRRAAPASGATSSATTASVWIWKDELELLGVAFGRAGLKNRHRRQQKHKEHKEDSSLCPSPPTHYLLSHLCPLVTVPLAQHPLCGCVDDAVQRPVGL